MLPKSYLIPSQNIALPAEYSTLELFQVHQLWMRKIMLRRERAPYWRLYYPYQETCILTHDGVDTLLPAGRVVLIPPDTDLAGRINAPLRMFYIHFCIGGKLAECRNAIFQLQEDSVLTGLVENATEHLRKKLPVDFHLCMNIAAIVSAAKRSALGTAIRNDAEPIVTADDFADAMRRIPSSITSDILAPYEKFRKERF